MDHYVPERDDDSRRIVRIARDWARDQQLPHVYDSQGICHVVVPQHGHIRPGMLCVGGDSHSPTGGAFGAYMFGVGSTEMLGVVVTGEIWLRVPRNHPHVVGRRAAAGVTAKDMMLSHDRPLRHERWALPGGRVLRAGGDGAVDAGAHDAVEHERRTRRAGRADRAGRHHARLPRRGRRAAGRLAPWFTDEDAEFEHHRFDAATLEPHVAAPHSPANAHGVGRDAGTPVDVAYIGACTGAKLDDLRAAARCCAATRWRPACA